MRSMVFIFGLVTVLSGCSTYVTEKTLPTGCVMNKYYLDADQDGWGDAADTEGTESCEPILSATKGENRTARNNLDCDDSTNLVTGRVGSVCPPNVVKGENSYAGQVVGTREYVAVIGDTLSGSASGVGSCGEYGWAGTLGESTQSGLAVFPNMQGLFRLINNIDDVLVSSAGGQTYYAGWVGIVYEDGAWVFSRDSEEFVPSEMGFCGGTAPNPADFGVGPKQLALVRTAGSGDWCFGRPQDANPSVQTPGEVFYGQWSANLICERPRPDVRCFVTNNEQPWMEPCSCRVARGESPEDLQASDDPESELGTDKDNYVNLYDRKLCLQD